MEWSRCFWALPSLLITKLVQTSKHQIPIQYWKIVLENWRILFWNKKSNQGMNTTVGWTEQGHYLTTTNTLKGPTQYLAGGLNVVVECNQVFSVSRCHLRHGKMWLMKLYCCYFLYQTSCNASLEYAVFPKEYGRDTITLLSIQFWNQHKLTTFNHCRWHMGFMPGSFISIIHCVQQNFAQWRETC